jgi:hypothetical protein
MPSSKKALGEILRRKGRNLSRPGGGRRLQRHRPRLPTAMPFLWSTYEWPASAPGRPVRGNRRAVDQRRLVPRPGGIARHRRASPKRPMGGGPKREAGVVCEAWRKGSTASCYVCRTLGQRIRGPAGRELLGQRKSGLSGRCLSGMGTRASLGDKPPSHRTPKLQLTAYRRSHNITGQCSKIGT